MIYVIERSWSAYSNFHIISIAHMDDSHGSSNGSHKASHDMFRDSTGIQESRRGLDEA
jgi:hypothetical protein